MFVFFTESHDSGNFYFCFRWILILFKREFSFPDVQRLWEVRILIVRLGFMTFKSYVVCCSKLFMFNLLPQNYLGNCKQTWHECSFNGPQQHVFFSADFNISPKPYTDSHCLKFEKKIFFLALLRWTMCENI